MLLLLCTLISAYAFVLSQAVYSTSFPEDVPINKGILRVGATDADSGSSAEIQYSLFGIGVEDFYMDANTGTFKYLISRVCNKNKQKKLSKSLFIPPHLCP